MCRSRALLELRLAAVCEQGVQQVFPLSVGPQVKPAEHQGHPLLE